MRHHVSIDTILFDLGNVLLKWNPRNLYRKIFADSRHDVVKNGHRASLSKSLPWQMGYPVSRCD